MLRYKIKEIVETDCLLLKDVKSRTQSNGKYKTYFDSGFTATKDGSITLVLDETNNQSNSLSIY